MPEEHFDYRSLNMLPKADDDDDDDRKVGFTFLGMLRCSTPVQCISVHYFPCNHNDL